MPAIGMAPWFIPAMSPDIIAAMPDPIWVASPPVSFASIPHAGYAARTCAHHPHIHRRRARTDDGSRLAGQLGEDFLGRCEAEIMQHDGHILTVDPTVGVGPDDERGGEQTLFGQAVVRMHPEGTALFEGKAVFMSSPRSDEGLSNFGPIKGEWWGQSVPVDHRRCVYSAHQLNVEPIGLIDIKSMPAGAIDNSKHCRGAPTDLNRARRHTERPKRTSRLRRKELRR